MTDTRGIVNPKRGFEHFRIRRFTPTAALTPYVDRFWCVSWDLERDEVFEQPILAHPAVNVVIEPDRAAVYGVPSRLGRQRLSGQGWAVAAMFRPGGARPFLDRPLGDWIDRVAPVADQWPHGGALVDAIRTVPGDPRSAESARTELLQGFLSGLAPVSVPTGTQDAVTIAAMIADDRTMRRVEDLAGRAGIETRSLQRLFAEQVGLSPKQVIRRYRLLEAAEAASEGAPVVWADVAQNLGFSDQAHLTRDFGATFGVSPARYADG